MRCQTDGSSRTKWLSAISILPSVLASVLAQVSPALAQDDAAEATSPAQNAADDAVGDQAPDTIIVIGQRVIVASLADIPVEQTYEEDDVSSYASTTIAEVLDLIQQENGDSDPALLVNGRPVRDRGDIADLPPEAITRIEKLPRGTAQRVSGAPGQRVYNVVLKSSFRSLALTGGGEMATEGGWTSYKGEAQLTSIKGQNRLNLAYRHGRSGTLLESERDFIPRAEPVPFAAAGNILPAFATEVDPALSALAGFPVVVVAVPEGLATPSLSDLLGGANRINPSDQSLYRSLRGRSDNHEVSLSGNRAFSDKISLSFNARLGWAGSDNLSGLPSGRFLLRPENAFSPFDAPVYLALNDPQRPLRSGFDNNTQSLSATLSGNPGRWRSRLSTRFDRRSQDFSFQFAGSLIGADAIVPGDINPFTGSLAGRISVVSRDTKSTTSTTRAELEAEGPLATLWAGPLEARLAASAGWVDFFARSDTGDRRLNRPETTLRGGLTLPLTGGEKDFLSFLGESDLSFDYSWISLGDFGSLKRRAVAMNWTPAEWLRLSASDSREGRPLSLELQSAPTTISPNVSYFDPLTGQSVEVTAIYGGAGDLTNDQLRSRSLGLALLPAKKYKVQIDAEYILDDQRDQVGPLPSPTTSIVLAFPERFQRDAGGVLTVVDNRSINFFRQRSERVRLGLRFAIPLIKGAAIGDASQRTPPLNLQFNASHTILLENALTIREGLPSIDMLDGGAVGIGGGQPRTISNAGLAVTRGSTGLRLDYRRRGTSRLIYGLLADPDLLSFEALGTLDGKAFVDLGQYLPNSKVAKGARITFAVDNLFNRRQRVVDQSGNVPQAFQPIRRDPIGRTVSFELRKLF